MIRDPAAIEALLKQALDEPNRIERALMLSTVGASYARLVVALSEAVDRINQLEAAPKWVVFEGGKANGAL